MVETHSQLPVQETPSLPYQTLVHFVCYSSDVAPLKNPLEPNHPRDQEVAEMNVLLEEYRQ